MHIQVTKLINIKRVTLLLMIVFLCSGCSSEIYYKFDNDKIESKITLEYTADEYRDYIKNSEAGVFDDGTLSNNDVKNKSLELFNSYKISSLKDNSGSVYTGELTSNNDKFKYVYSYDYKYSDFKNNSVLNECFLSPVIKEDSGAYYFALYGDFTCRYTPNMKLVIEGKDRLLNSNSKNVKNGRAEWTINEDMNDIYFAISKTSISKTPMKGLYIFGGIVLTIVIVIVCYLIKRAREY